MTFKEKIELVIQKVKDSRETVSKKINYKDPINCIINVDRLIGVYYEVTDEVLEGIKELLIEKNTKYGNAALEPLKVFSKLDAVESIKVRLDDKLKRIINSGLNIDTEDTLSDIIGYLILWEIGLMENADND